MLNEEEIFKHILQIYPLLTIRVLATDGHGPPVRELPEVLDKNTYS